MERSPSSMKLPYQVTSPKRMEKSVALHIPQANFETPLVNFLAWSHP